MNKKVNPNFVKANAGGGGGWGNTDNFVVGAENYKPPPKGFYNRKDAMMNGNTQDPKQEVISKSLIAAYKRAKQSGTFNCPSHNLKVFPKELANFAEMTIPGENWWDGNDLRKIDVSNNEIEEVPEDIANQLMIEHMNLNTNLIKSLPSSLF